MSKKKQQKRTQAKPLSKDTDSLGFMQKKVPQYVIVIGLLLILFVILLKPLVIDGKVPQGVDVIASRSGSLHVERVAQEHNEERLYNPFIFNGMPSYHRIGPKAWSLDMAVNWIGRLFSSNVFIFYIVGAVGFLFLARFLGVNLLVSVFGLLAFTLVPHFQALWAEGHMTKFRALMYLPWVVLAFLNLTQRRNILAAALFALVFGLQIRTQHYQIIFYTGLIIVAIAVYPSLKLLLEKKYREFSKFILLGFIAGAFALLSAAQPIFLASEYLPYSKRGKTTVDLNDNSSGNSSGTGVSSEYATQWSTHPSELMTWIIPRALGGTSGEVYDGKEFPHLKDRPIPGYWGHMPFTQSYEYFGVVTWLLALIGIVFLIRRNKILLALGMVSLFFIFLSFGRHFHGFYDIFYNNVPYFNKFRAPMMSVTVVYLIVALFAALGLQYIIRGLKEADRPKILYTVLAYSGLLLVLYLIGQGFSFMKPGGENYKPEELQVITQIREELFLRDALRSLLLAVLTGGVVLLGAYKKIKPVILVPALTILLLFDLVGVQQRKGIDYVDMDRLERQNFTATATDSYILEDDDVFRIFPVGKLFGDNRWIYHHASIGGYSPIKPYAIEEIVENCLYGGWESNFPVNWNVLRMLNVKYLVLEGNFRHPKLELVNRDPANNYHTFRFREWNKRAFFVNDYEVIPDEVERLKRLNQESLNTSLTAVLEEEPGATTNAPDSSWVRMTRNTLLDREFDVFTDKQALLVLSENYYPPGWHIFLDDERVEKAFKADHTLYAIVVPEGTHSVKMEFHPDSYYKYKNVSFAANGLVFLLIIVGLVLPIVRTRMTKEKPLEENKES